MHNEDWIPKELDALRSQSLFRQLRAWPETGGKITADGRTFLNFSGNDYLNLARHPRVIEAAGRLLAAHGGGATASRLMAGALPCHEQLERQLAALKGYPAALLFGSGWHANAGAIPALVGRDDFVYADKLVHASVIDAVLLSRAELHRFNHNDPGHLAVLLSRCPPRGRRLVVTESVFSMDGDLAPLKEITVIAVKSGALLMVDEAHATGIFGPGGSGRVRELGLEASVNLSMGTLSKALGGQGGFIACSEDLRDWLVNRARSFIFTTAPAPAVAGAALGALDVLRSQPDLGPTLLDNAAFFRARLQALGLNTLESRSQIVPVLIGDPARTLAVSRRLEEKGILAVAVRPPTVPSGTARLRLSVTLAHDRADLEAAALAIAGAAREEGVP